MGSFFSFEKEPGQVFHYLKIGPAIGTWKRGTIQCENHTGLRGIIADRIGTLIESEVIELEETKFEPFFSECGLFHFGKPKNEWFNDHVRGAYYLVGTDVLPENSVIHEKIIQPQAEKIKQSLTRPEYQLFTLGEGENEVLEGETMFLAQERAKFNLKKRFGAISKDTEFEQYHEDLVEKSDVMKMVQKRNDHLKIIAEEMYARIGIFMHELEEWKNTAKEISKKALPGFKVREINDPLALKYEFMKHFQPPTKEKPEKPIQQATKEEKHLEIPQQEVPV